MNKFIKYYSYNQLIEKYDILVMTQQEYLDNKNNLDNPQVIVCVNREGGPRKPKAPKWFTDYMEEFAKKNNLRFEKIEDVLRRNNLK